MCFDVFHLPCPKLVTRISTSLWPLLLKANNELIGSAPLLNTKIKGVALLLTAKAAGKFNAGASPYLSPNVAVREREEGKGRERIPREYRENIERISREEGEEGEKEEESEQGEEGDEGEQGEQGKHRRRSVDGSKQPFRLLSYLSQTCLFLGPTNRTESLSPPTTVETRSTCPTPTEAATPPPAETTHYIGEGATSREIEK